MAGRVASSGSSTASRDGDDLDGNCCAGSWDVASGEVDAGTGDERGEEPTEESGLEDRELGTDIVTGFEASTMS